MEHCPADITSLLKELCIKYMDEPEIARETNIFELDGGGPPRPRPQDFLHLFIVKSEYLVEFLEHLVYSRTGWDRQIYNTLVEHYLVSIDRLFAVFIVSNNKTLIVLSCILNFLVL